MNSPYLDNVKLPVVFSLFGGNAAAEMTTQTLTVVQSAIQWTAILLAALAGAYEARRRDLDFFGALVIAFVVSVGGGTLRDVLLARYPLFWVENPVYFDLIFSRCETRTGRIAPQMLSRQIEDTATITSPLVPWNTCGAYMAATLGVATAEKAPEAYAPEPDQVAHYGVSGYDVSEP